MARLVRAEWADVLYLPGHERHGQRCEVVNSYKRNYELYTGDDFMSYVVRFPDGVEMVVWTREVERNKFALVTPERLEQQFTPYEKRMY